MPKFYITTPIYYVNDVASIGHAYTTIAADVLARWHRLLGDDVFFLTGLDENSQKTVQAAEKLYIKDIQKYADDMAEKWKRVWKVLNISYDGFIRTTEERHKKVVNDFFMRVYKRGDIYKGKYEGLYCDGCEAFLTESDLVEGKCPYHKTEPKKITEENYFFKLSKYQKKLLDHIIKNPGFIQPSSRRKEVMSFIKEGLKDISISRQKMVWGIPLPVDEKHRFWVWFDALLNYISGAPTKYWPADIHLMAKDIIRFHCIIWEAMLLSAGYELPKKIFAHGFLTVDGQKMSKSLGNVIDPLYLSEKYSVDSLRYFLLREIPFGEDGDFSERALRARLNSELADVFGNFVHRTLTFIWTNFDGRVPKGEMDKKLQHKVDRKIKRIKKDLDDLKLHAGLEEIMSMAKAGNEHFQHSEPWRRIKEDKKRASDCLFSCVQLVKDLCILLYPFIPATCDDLAEQINIKIKSLEQINEPLPPGHRINKPKPLFKKVVAEPEKVVETKMISQKDFSKLDLRVAKVKQVERLGRNLLKIELDLADRIMTTVAGIGNAYEEKDLVGKQVVIVANLEPKTIAGVKSECMLLAVDAKKPVLIVPEKEVGAGLRVF